MLLPILVGRDPLHRTALMLEFDRAARANLDAKAAIEDALYDLGGRLLGAPVHALLGGALADRLPSNQAIGFGDSSEAAGLARELVGRGFRHLKVRVGMEPFERDVACLETVREVVGPDIGLAIDANGTWSRRDALTSWAGSPLLARLTHVRLRR